VAYKVYTKIRFKYKCGFFGGRFFRRVYPKKTRWVFWVHTRSQVSEPCFWCTTPLIWTVVVFLGPSVCDVECSGLANSCCFNWCRVQHDGGRLHHWLVSCSGRHSMYHRTWHSANDFGYQMWSSVWPSYQHSSCEFRSTDNVVEFREQRGCRETSVSFEDIRMVPCCHIRGIVVRYLLLFHLSTQTISRAAATKLVNTVFIYTVR